MGYVISAMIIAFIGFIISIYIIGKENRNKVN